MQLNEMTCYNLHYNQALNISMFLVHLLILLILCVLGVTRIFSESSVFEVLLYMYIVDITTNLYTFAAPQNHKDKIKQTGTNIFNDIATIFFGGGGVNLTCVTSSQAYWQ